MVEIQITPADFSFTIGDNRARIVATFSEVFDCWHVTTSDTPIVEDLTGLLIRPGQPPLKWSNPLMQSAQEVVNRVTSQ